MSGHFWSFSVLSCIAVRLYQTYTSTRFTSASGCVSYAGLARVAPPRTHSTHPTAQIKNSVLPPATAPTVRHDTRFPKHNPER
jgi:hypothetical protein